MQTFLNTLAIIIVFTIGIYLGIGGMANVEYNTKLKALSEQKPAIDDTIPQQYGAIVYLNRLEMQKGDIVIQKKKFLSLYPWIEQYPDLISLLITCCAFSLLGTFIFVLNGAANKRKKIVPDIFLLQLLTGFLTGFAVLGLSYLLPLILVREGDQIRPITLMFLSLFAGMYSNKFYDKLSTYFERILSKEE